MKPVSVIRRAAPLGVLSLALAAALPPSMAEAAATVNKGDTAWMLVATALVVLMTLPGLALFYGGLVRSKNILSVLMQVLTTFSIIATRWPSPATLMPGSPPSSADCQNSCWWAWAPRQRSEPSPRKPIFRNWLTSSSR
jgi:hypothetical protein